MENTEQSAACSEEEDGLSLCWSSFIVHPEGSGRRFARLLVLVIFDVEQVKGTKIIIIVM